MRDPGIGKSSDQTTHGRTIRPTQVMNFGPRKVQNSKNGVLAKHVQETQNSEAVKVDMVVVGSTMAKGKKVAVPEFILLLIFSAGDGFLGYCLVKKLESKERK